MPKQEIIDSYQEFSTKELIHGSTIPEIIETFQEIQRHHIKKNHTNHVFEIDYDTHDMWLYVFREETDEEYNERLLKESETTIKHNKYREAAERAEYERLKAKYG